MKMSFIEQLIYPKFNRYLRDSLPAVAEVGAIKRAFQRYGQLDHAALKRALKWGEEPTVNVADLVDAYGEFTPTPGSNEIRIDRKLVRRFEAGTDKVQTKSGHDVHLAGATILHEMIHWADNLDGVDHPDEEGEEFEKSVYGKVLTF